MYTDHLERLAVFFSLMKWNFLESLVSRVLFWWLCCSFFSLSLPLLTSTSHSKYFTISTHLAELKSVASPYPITISRLAICNVNISPKSIYYNWWHVTDIIGRVFKVFFSATLSILVRLHMVETSYILHFMNNWVAKWSRSHESHGKWWEPCNESDGGGWEKTHTTTKYTEWLTRVAYCRHRIYTIHDWNKYPLGIPFEAYMFILTNPLQF